MFHSFGPFCFYNEFFSLSLVTVKKCESRVEGVSVVGVWILRSKSRFYMSGASSKVAKGFFN